MSNTSSLDAARWVTAETPVRDVAFLKRGLICYALVVALVSWLYQGWQAQRDRQATESAAFNNLAVISLSLENHLRAMINDGVGAAEAGLNDVRTSRGAQSSETQVTNVLARMLTGGDYVHSLFIVTPTLYYTAERGKTERRESAAPPWLEELRKQPSSNWMGTPQRDGTGQISFIVIARRAGTLGTEPVWVGAEFGIESLDRLYKQVHLDGGAVAVVSATGTLLFRSPPLQPSIIGENVSSWEVFRRAQAANEDISYAEGINHVLRKRWLYVGRRLRDFDVLVVSGQDRDTALAPWLKRTHVSMSYAAASTAALFLLTSILYRTLNRHFHALEESEERYEVAVIGANEGIWDWDIRANRIYYSPRFGELLGYVSTADFRNGFSSIWNQVHPDDENAARADLDRHLESGKPFDVRVRLRTQAGDYRWYRATGQALWSDGVPYRMAGSISDIHEQLRLQESLLAARENQVQAQAKLSQYLLSAQEQERKRIANELHDSLGQNLSLITNRAELALRANDLPPQAAYQLEAIARTTSEAIADIRRMLGNLLPQQIEFVGLTAAIVDLAATLAETSKLAIERHVDDIDDVFTGNSATHVYRIIQESLHNVIKHAAARRVVLNIERDVRHVRIAIHDDGQGFELNDASSRRGIGLTSLAERAHILGGQFSIASTLGRGTAVMLVIPIAEETATVAVADETASFT